MSDDDEGEIQHMMVTRVHVNDVVMAMGVGDDGKEG